MLDYNLVYDRLLTTLAELSTLLRSHGETHWAEWIERSNELIAAGDAYGLEKLLAAFGGMGSINDLVLRELNGRARAPSEEDGANGRLRNLLTSAFEDAQALKRSLGRQP